MASAWAARMIRSVSLDTRWPAVEPCPLDGRFSSVSSRIVGGLFLIGAVNLLRHGLLSPILPNAIQNVHKLHDEEGGAGDPRHDDPARRSRRPSGVHADEVDSELVLAVVDLRDVRPEPCQLLGRDDDLSPAAAALRQAPLPVRLCLRSRADFVTWPTPPRANGSARPVS
jgi:hypothetical protein